MKSLLRRILESEDDFNSLYHKKNKWVDIQGLEKKILSKNLFDLVQHAYKDIGGHFEIKSPDDLLQYQFIKAEDVDDDPEADVMQVYKKNSCGNKINSCRTRWFFRSKERIIKYSGKKSI
jgi:hypothetical protein